MQYEANADKVTPAILTNHMYFNLAGEESGKDALGLVMQVRAKHYLPVLPTMMTSGEVLPVAGTPFDFIEPHRVGERISQDNEQLRNGNGYDHCFALDNRPESFARPADVVLTDAETKRSMELWTTEPGVQFYSGNWLDVKSGTKSGKPYGRRFGLCLETQVFYGLRLFSN